MLLKGQISQTNFDIEKMSKSHEFHTEQEKLQKRLMNRSSSSEEQDQATKQKFATRSSLMQQDHKEDNHNKKAKNASKTFRRLFSYTWKQKLIFFIANFSLVMSSVGFILLPLICGQMVDVIKDNGSLIDGTIKFIILTVFMAIFSSIRGQKIMVALRNELFDKLLSKDISYYDTNKTGQLLSRLGNDIGTVYSVCTDNISILIRNFLQFFGSLLLLWLLSWKLTLFILVLTPIISFVILKIVKVSKRLQKQYSNKVAFTTSLATEVFSNIRVVKSFSNEDLESRNYQGLLDKVYQTGKKKHILYGIMLFIMTIFANFLILIILYFGGQLCINGDLSIGDLTSFVLYTITLTVGFASVSGIANQVISAMGICQHIFQIMDEPIKVLPGILKPDLDRSSRPLIQFVNASFSYPSKQNVYVLKNINLTINQGQSIAIVGPSGSGKSSIVSLILRFYDLNEGQILINGKNIKQIDTNQLRKQIGFVSQQPTLFSGNLRENIQYGISSFQKNDLLIDKALQIANAKQFVYNSQLFPDDLNTLVGQRGVKLSGGQKQRIAIARCIAKEPKIMIFDEATSALDAESEYQVQKAIDGLVGKRQMTMIIVAHRLSTIINCDRILVIKNGELIEQGTHCELLSKKGAYASLVNRQLTSK